MGSGADGDGTDKFFAVPQRDEVRRAVSLIFEAHGTHQTYPPGVSLVCQGADPPAIWRILSGLAKCVMTGPDGTQTMIALRGPGWLLGVNSVLLRTKSPVSVITASPCTIAGIARQVLERLIVSDADVPPSLLALQAAEIEDLTMRYGELASGSSRTRLLRILRLLLDAERRARVAPATVKLQLPLKEWELAQFVAVTPAHLCRLFGALERDRLLRRNRGWLEILDADKFAKEGDGG